MSFRLPARCAQRLTLTALCLLASLTLSGIAGIEPPDLPQTRPAPALAEGTPATLNPAPALPEWGLSVPATLGGLVLVGLWRVRRRRPSA
jgi:hypothetical protein